VETPTAPKQARTKNPKMQAILLALFVTLLWSSSWVIIKLFIQEIPPLTFAGLRYSLAFLLLMPALYLHRQEVVGAKLSDLKWLIILGVVYYGITMGGQFFTLKYVDTISYSLMLNFTSPLVAIFGIFLLHERVKFIQWVGLALFLCGVFLYFHQVANLPASSLGVVIGCLTVVSNALGAIVGRFVNKARLFSPIVVTAVSMGIGALILIIMALSMEGLPSIDPKGWLAIGWLALVNTALAFWLWNTSLQVLNAMESSVINNTMLIQISLLSWFFLGEKISLLEGMGLLVAVVGVILVNIKFQALSTSSESQIGLE